MTHFAFYKICLRSNHWSPRFSQNLVSTSSHMTLQVPYWKWIPSLNSAISHSWSWNELILLLHVFFHAFHSYDCTLVCMSIYPYSYDQGYRPSCLIIFVYACTEIWKSTNCMKLQFALPDKVVVMKDNKWRQTLSKFTVSYFPDLNPNS